MHGPYHPGGSYHPGFPYFYVNVLTKCNSGAILFVLLRCTVRQCVNRGWIVPRYTQCSAWFKK